MGKPKARFSVGQIVNLPVKIVKIDRRTTLPTYWVIGLERGWFLTDQIYEDELRSLTKERGKP